MSRKHTVVCVKSITLSAFIMIHNPSDGWAQAAASDVLRIGVLTDLSGVYARPTGPGSVIAAKMAVDAVGGVVAGRRVEVIAGDHRNNGATGRAIAEKWFTEEGVEMITDLAGSGAAIPIAEVITAHNKVGLVTSAGSSELTGPRCSKNIIQWTFDTWSLANSIINGLAKNNQKSWYFIATDNLFGRILQHEAGAAITRSGGTVLGSTVHTLGADSMRGQIEVARDSGASAIGFLTAGDDTARAMREAGALQLWRGGQRMVGFFVLITDIHQIGQQTMQGLTLASPFYWDLNDKTRRFSVEFAARHGGAKPTMLQAGVYSAVLHYLKSVARVANMSDGAAVVAEMKRTPSEDDAFGQGVIRADGRRLTDLYLFEVKPPRASTQPWDYYKLVRTIPAADAYRPLADGGCPLVANN